MPTLEQLLSLPVATPRSFADDGRLIYLSNAPGSNQLFCDGEQLTHFDEPVSGGHALPDGGILIGLDSGGNERHQLHLWRDGVLEPSAVDPEFMHVGQVLSADRTLVAYACNSRNGEDFDVVVHPLDGGPRSVAALGGYCEPVAFSPDNRFLVVGRLTEKTSDNDLHLVDLETGAIENLLPHDGDAYLGDVMWTSPTSFLFASSLGRDLVAIARFDLETRTHELVHEDAWDLHVIGTPGAAHVAVEVNEDGFSRIELRDAQTLELRATVPLPGRGVADPFYWAFSADGTKLAFQFTSSREPGDAWIFDTETGETTRATRSADVELTDWIPEPELHRFASFDGESVPVYLLRSESAAAPVIVTIHGGPEAQARPIWGAVNAYWLSRGFAVAVPNVRGSTGYGKRYEHLDDRERRLDSVRDLVALADWLATHDGLDAARVALIGGSYGGYMTLAGLAFFPGRFAAGVDIVGISSLVTFLENTAIWRRAFREREYGSLAHDRELLDALSPIHRVDDIDAPLLIVHGANDPRVPLSEAEQLHAALAARGVDTELLVYGDEGHGLNKLKNRLDAYPRVAAFLERVLVPT